MKIAIKKWINPKNGQTNLYFNDGISRAKVWIVNENNGPDNYTIKYSVNHYSDFSLIHREGCNGFLDMACNLVEYVCRELKINKNFKFEEILKIAQ